MRPAQHIPGLTGQDVVPRHSHGERLAHWAVAVSYIALFLSGLPLFHPFFYWLTALFGGAALMRVLHPFLGAAFAVLFYVYALRLVRDNLFLTGDTAWLKKMTGYMNKRGAEVPVPGKYNAGEKIMYWSMIVVIALLLLSGIVQWRPYFAPSMPVGLRRSAGLLHVVMAFVMFVGIGIHIYAAFWTKGSIRAMTRGYVSRTWARVHHPGWYAKMAGKEGS